MTRNLSKAGLRAALIAMLGAGLGACASRSAPPDEAAEPELRMAVERVFDGERPFMRGDPSGVELHWWLTRDSEGDIARALAPYAVPREFLPPETIERLRLSGIRVIAVPLAELFVVHQIATPRAGWSRRWLGQTPEWVQLLRARSVGAGTRSMVYGAEARLPGGILRLLGRGWMLPQSAVREGERRIEAAMYIEVVAQVQQRRPDSERPNLILQPTADFQTPLEQEGPLLEELLLEVTVPRGYAIVLTTDAPDADWDAVEGVTRENLIAELQRREAGGTGEPEAQGEASEQARFGPAPAAPATDADEQFSDESAQVFETLDAPMPSLLESFGPRAAPVPTAGQLLLETRDSLSRPLRAVIILIPRLPEQFRLLP